MSVPYEMKPMSGLTIPGGEALTIAIDFPSRSVISKIIIIQYSGTPAAFTATLFNHASVLEGEARSESDSEGPDVGPIPEECYMVSPAIRSDANGKLIYLSDIETGGHGLVNFNQDVVKDRERGYLRKVYLRIQPDGSGEKRYAVALGGEAME